MLGWVPQWCCGVNGSGPRRRLVVDRAVVVCGGRLCCTSRSTGRCLSPDSLWTAGCFSDGTCFLASGCLLQVQEIAFDLVRGAVSQG